MSELTPDEWSTIRWALEWSAQEMPTRVMDTLLALHAKIAAIPEPIRWEDSVGFDEAYACDWVRTTAVRCGTCGLAYTRWHGDPCRAKADFVPGYWVPKQP